MSPPRTAVIVGFLLSLVLAGRGSGAIRAGAAKNAITPDLAARTVYLAGFGHNRIATAVHDPLYVRCLALQAGQTAGVCVAHLICLVYDAWPKIPAAIRNEAPRQSPLA